MTSKAEANRVRKINDVIAHIDPDHTHKNALKALIQRSLDTVSYDDLNTFSSSDLYQLCLSAWKFIYTRKPKEIKVRALNPRSKTFTHTVIEINCRDMPFLVDSIRMEINRRNLLVHYVMHIGGLGVVRDSKHHIKSICKQTEYDSNSIKEAVIHVQIDRQSDKNLLNQLVESLQSVLQDVAAAVDDWLLMRKQLHQALFELEEQAYGSDSADLAESKDFLRWIDSDHFTFLGYREYIYKRDGDNIKQEVVKGSSLGTLRRHEVDAVSSLAVDKLPKLAQELLLSPQILIIAKTDTRSTVHRPAYKDYIGVKLFDKKGNIIGERRFVGLYTSVAYNGNPKHIPFLRNKVAQVLKMSNLPPKGHASKTLLNILETMPRDDLFQAPADELLRISLGILHLQERQRVRLFMRKDVYGRYYSCLVYVPKDIFNTNLRKKFQHILHKELASIYTDFTTLYSDSVLVRIHFTFHIDEKNSHPINIKALEHRLAQEARSWNDNLHDKLIDIYGEALGVGYYNKYRTAFPEGYKENYNAHTAARDIYHMETISDEHPLDMSFYRSMYKGQHVLRFKLFNRATTMPLSDVLPLLENMDLRVLGERPNEIVLDNGDIVWINDFDLVYKGEGELDIDAVKEIFQEAFIKIWSGYSENDGFNRLVLKAGLTWRETAILRAYAHYLYQIGFTYSQTYIEETFIEHDDIAKKIINLFRLKFDPKAKKRKIEIFVKKVEKSFDDVTSLDQDRILRRYLDLINATLRTNFFQVDENGNHKVYYAYKLASDLIPDIPSPAPALETFVYSPRVVGVHLRSGKVARGGIRWSDRREDYRTEVLGLMKAQSVKNSVIVPMGAKGGFYPKKSGHLHTREEILEEGIACYRIFISALLDVVDNLVDSKVVHPENTVCYDGDDSYLVVAADKGTASFSDIANEISMMRDYWLGDAFASGGSTGYDHKKMGITARGAWESVKRNFRELTNLNTQKDEFTVVGIGDMAGDVFGNGMLQSKHTKLIAAFNHLHIFLDPNPDAKASFKERQRLFKLPRSQWTDYDTALISKGGGVFSRSEKLIKLSKEIRLALSIEAEELDPDSLVKAILTSPVDLLWNGGIGTFVKASDELHSNAGDKSNDGIRVNANQLRCRIVAEGGNLGLTQLARIEYAGKGGLIYTDFVDNSAGVDCSDHEVNIKILLHAVVSSGKLTEKERNKLLSEMTDDVAKMVLRHNYLQTQSISFSAFRSKGVVETYRRFINDWDKSNKLNRELMFLPNNKIMQHRKANGQGMNKPEIAVLLSYTKILLKQDIVESDIPEDEDFNDFLSMAFPQVLCERYKKEMQNHSLRREIIATQLSNYISNYMGVFFVNRMKKELGSASADIIRAYVCSVKVFGIEKIWHEIESLDYKISAKLQARLFEIVYFVVRRTTRWFLKNHRKGINIEIILQHFQKNIAELQDHIVDFLHGYDMENYEALYLDMVNQKVPKETAALIARCNVLFPMLDIVEAAKVKDYSCDLLAKVYYEIGPRLSLDWLRNQIKSQKVESQWEEQMRHTLLDDIDWQQRRLSVNLLGLAPKREKVEDQIEYWFQSYEDIIKRWNDMVAELKATRVLGFTMFSVAIRSLLDLSQTTSV